jgi:DNA-binding PadR family transcriptional regulator
MSESTGCSCDGGTLDRLIQPAILVVLAAGPLHGYRLVERIGELPGSAGRNPDASGVYRTLRTMEERGLVAATWDISTSGPARKSYQITPSGGQCLERWIGTLENYRREISALLGAARKAAGEQQRATCCD